MQEVTHLANAAYRDWEKYLALALKATNECVKSVHMENAMRAFHLWKAYQHLMSIGGVSCQCAERE